MAVGDLEQQARERAAQRSTTELTADLVRDLTALMHDELALARAELTEKGKHARLGAGLLGAAGVLALVGVGCVTACVIAAISIPLPVWAAALIVGGAYLVVAGIVALLGRFEVRQAAPPLPEAAMHDTMENVEWIKTRASSTNP